MRKLLFLLLFSVLAALISLSTGSYPVLEGIQQGDGTAWKVLFHLRFPRFAAAFLVGIALSFSGSGLQTLLRNPLADPFVLGVSSGSAFGMLVSLLIGFSPLSVTTFLFSFAGGMVTVVIVYLMGSLRGRVDTTRMLLSGVIINALFASLILIGLSYVHHRQLSSYMYWMMGNISDITITQVSIMALMLSAALIPLILLIRQLDVYLLGEEIAISSGVKVERLKITIFLIASILTGITVTFVGIIGFVGLIVPNICRRLWGSGHASLLLTAGLSGGIFLVLADTVARLFPGGNLPAGAITALVGAPLFLFLLGKSR